MKKNCERAKLFLKNNKQFAKILQDQVGLKASFSGSHFLTYFTC